jgi:DNA modification methylase
MRTNVLYCGDNLEIIDKFIEPEKVDLIYIDPPFFSGKTYEVIFGDTGEKRAFEDRWKGGEYHYINWLSARIAKMRETLNPTGSFYIHLDWHIVHHMKVELDRIFGSDNFRNEIIWQYHRWTATSKDFQRMHDTILRYSKTNKYIFNQQYENYQETTLKYHKWETDKQGRRYYIKRGKSIKPYRVYMDEQGVKISDVWELPQVGPIAKERLGYPTQKPEKLLKRIISASSNPGDIVADFFCGCGTALAVAQMLGRRWLGCDVSPTALKVVKQRLEKVGATNIKMVNVPKTLAELKAMKPFEFQNYVIDLIQGTHTPKLVGDYGIDGYTLFHHDPVQVKQQEHVGRPDIQKFESAIRRDKKSKGYFFALGFTKQAHDEVARVKMEEGLEIELVKIRDLITADPPPTFL